MQTLARKVHAVLTVKCTQCGKTRKIEPGEVSENDYPMCPICYMPMTLIKVSARPGK